MFNAYKILPPHLRYLGALIISILNFVFVVTTVMPVLKSFQWLQTQMVTIYPLPQTDYVTFIGGAMEVLHPWVIVVSVIFFTLSLWPLVRLAQREDGFVELGLVGRVRIKHRTKLTVENEDQSVIRYLSLIPFAAIAYLQFMNRTQALAFTMSGDARNVFLQVMRMRLNLSFPSFTEMIGNGRFGESLSVGISVANGNMGFPNINDQYAIRSVYIIALSLIVTSLAAIVIGRSTTLVGISKFIRNLALFSLALFLIANPYPISEILRSGFFTMFISMGFLVATIAIVSSVTTVRGDVVLLGVITTAMTYLSYQLFALIVLPTSLVILGVFIWSHSKRIRSKVVWIFVVAAGILYLLIRRHGIIQRFKLRINDGGSIQSTGLTLTIAVLVLGCVILIVGKKELRLLSLKIVGITSSSLITLQIIAITRGDDPDSYGYYGTKIMYAANYVSWFLLVAMVTLLLTSLMRKISIKTFTRTSRVLASSVMTTLTLATVGVFILATLHFAKATSPVARILNGWDSPTETVVNNTLNLWNKGETNYIVAQYSSDSNDRIANFWSPYFWEANRWQWTYTGYMVDAAGLCDVIAGRKVLLVTSSGSLVRQLRGYCPVSIVEMSVKYLQ